jgi:hypothetical protein
VKIRDFAESGSSSYLFLYKPFLRSLLNVLERKAMYCTVPTKETAPGTLCNANCICIPFVFFTVKPLAINETKKLENKDVVSGEQEHKILSLPQQPKTLPTLFVFTTPHPPLQNADLTLNTKENEFTKQSRRNDALRVRNETGSS